jgi:hypothetical protein
MDEALQRALQAIAEEEAEARRKGPIELDDAFWRAIARIEAAPWNQDGADKTWVHRLMEDDREYFRRVVRK